MGEIDCYLCQEKSSRGLLDDREGGEPAYHVNCPACGKYRINDYYSMVLANTDLDDDERWRRLRLAGVIRHDNDRGRYDTLITDATVQELLSRSRPPRTALEQMEMFLVMVAEHAAYVGDVWKVKDWRPTARRLYFPDPSAGKFREFLAALVRAGYVDHPIGTGEVSLNKDGLLFVEQIRTRPRYSKQAFVAMWFNPEMEPAFSEGIKPALESCGYSVYRVDRAASDAKIDDEIVANIRKSRLMVADLTGMRPNVFYEAGMAHGLGLILVLACRNTGSPGSPARETWFKEVSEFAFDIRQYPMVIWTEPTDLGKQLETRIRALGYDLSTGDSASPSA